MWLVTFAVSICGSQTDVWARKLKLERFFIFYSFFWCFPHWLAHHPEGCSLFSGVRTATWASVFIAHTLPRGQCGENQPRGQRRESNPARGIQSTNLIEARFWSLKLQHVNTRLSHSVQNNAHRGADWPKCLYKRQQTLSLLIGACVRRTMRRSCKTVRDFYLIFVSSAH